MTAATFRRDYLSKPIFRWARQVLPTLSDTEREAIEAGDTWWDAELFAGNPDWRKLLAMPPAKLTAEEQAFLDGPVAELCGKLDEWRITWELRDLPPEVWDFLKRHKFFAMIIPKRYGGLGFSATAHSEVIRKISTRSLTAAVTAMVPNSLGPGELLLHFGTKAQQDYWLPRLTAAEEIPCFALTSPEAGSDAASMIDSGVVCGGTWQGREVIGIKLNWHKRYITLGPIATVIGLAFKLHDPDHLLGEREDIGITVALVPANLPGVEIGRRHLPTMMVFQNGPTSGRDVFIPLDHIIGGEAQAGKGWRMLMSALAAGRGISLPSLSAAGAAFAAHVTGAYTRIREQFHVPIGRFQAIQERLGRMAATAYLIDAARRLTCADIDAGHKPAVITAIMKEQATERLRVVANDAMDVHGGKAVQEGPHNYLGGLYRSVPIGITVEGANIVTRSLIQFGQGAIRSHPYLLKEMAALEDPDHARGLEEFDRAFWGHVGHGWTSFSKSNCICTLQARCAPVRSSTSRPPTACGCAARGYALSVPRFLWLSGTPAPRSLGRSPAGELRPRGLRMHRGLAPPRERPPRQNFLQSTLLHAQRDNLPRDRGWLDRWARPSRTDVRCLFTADLLHRPQCLSPVGGAGDAGMDDQVSAAEGRRDWP
jgi:acyl-CoA dehydrogenase